MNPPLPLELLLKQAPTTMGRADPDVFIVDTDNAVFDLRNSTIIGCGDLAPGVVRSTPADAYFGRAIIIRKAKNVTIKNVNIRGFKVAIYAEDAPGLRLENCDVSNNYRMRLKSTPQREHYDDWLWPHKNDNGEWLKYGAGIYLVRCDDAKIINCRARNGQNGICISRSDRVEVKGNDMSFMSGWGLAMHRSNHCRVVGNRFDYCVRGYSHGVYNRGQDSAGILVFEQCSDNIFAYNSATHGGDGFFLYAGDETLKVTGTGGCNRNVLYKNDFSYAVTNGIEATFSDQNVFLGNKLSHCDHGIWGGYSANTLIAENKIDHCRIGIAIEHGRENRIVRNQFADNTTGIHLWWDDDKDLVASEYGRKRDTNSQKEMMEFNEFKSCKTAVLADHSQDLEFSSNTLEACETIAMLRGRTTVTSLGFSENHATLGVIENKTDHAILALNNILAKEVEPRGKWDLHPSPGSAARIEDPSSIIGGAVAKAIITPARDWALVRELKLPVVGPKPPVLPDNAQTSRAPGIPSGKETLVIDEWGPYDFVEPRLFPARYIGAAPVSVNALGPSGATFEVRPGIDPHFTAAPPSGKAPGRITITPRLEPDAPSPGVYHVEVSVRIGNNEQRLTCDIIIAEWNVRYFTWTPALDPLTGDENWKKIIAAAPLRSEERDNLDLPFGGGGPTPEVKERFALIAETRLSLPAGKWRLRTISDDGIRVYFDDKRVIDNWTWHVPAEDAAVVEIVAPSQHDIRVEYFEITGHAQLQFFLEPAN